MIQDRMSRHEASALLTAKPKRKNKYNAKKVTHDGITFDSTHEGKRYLVLREEQRHGFISDLTLQRRFDLIVNGKKVGFYKLDLDYIRNGKRIYEDAKGVRTAIYRLKKKMVEAQYGIEITEI